MTTTFRPLVAGFVATVALVAGCSNGGTPQGCGRRPRPPYRPMHPRWNRPTSRWCSGCCRRSCRSRPTGGRIRRDPRHRGQHRHQRARRRGGRHVPGPAGGQPDAGSCHAEGRVRTRRPRSDHGERAAARPTPGHLRRLKQARGRRHRAGHGQPAGPDGQRHEWHRLGGRPHGDRAVRGGRPGRHPADVVQTSAAINPGTAAGRSSTSPERSSACRPSPRWSRARKVASRPHRDRLAIPSAIPGSLAAPRSSGR